MSLDIQFQINELIKKIKWYNQRYYEDHFSEISDFDFDVLMAKLQNLEFNYPEYILPDSPTQRVGGSINKSFQTVKHRSPMLSLSNTYSKEDLIAFDLRIAKNLKESYQYVCELKFDGVAVSLIYKNAKLVQAITRGDGIQGDDITANIKTIAAIPLVLKDKNCPENFEIRGEVFISLRRFKQLNQNIIQENKKRYLKNKSPLSLLANPRNTVSGALKLKDTNAVAQKKLNCYSYSLIIKENFCKTHFESIKQLEKWNFNICQHYKLCQNIEEVQNFIELWESKRKNLPFDIDGIVIKVSNLEQQKYLGNTAKSPRWAIAYKYPSQTMRTVLKSIDYQIGRTGAITPVGNLKPIQLAGTTVKRASLHNANEIQRLDLHIGDIIYVEKGGEVIPKITGVNYSERLKDAIPISFIDCCPNCNTNLIRFKNEATYYCPNKYACEPQIIRQIEHFVHKKAMNINFLGKKIITQLVQNKLIHNVADLYDLKLENLLVLDRFAEKSAKNLIRSIQESKKANFENVLFGLGIRFVGNTVAKHLVHYYLTLEELKKATLEELENIEEIGTKIAKSIIDFFSEDYNLKIIGRLRLAGLQFSKPKQEKENLTSTKLQDLSFVISGTFENFTRDKLKEVIRENGGKVLSAISKNTNYILVGNKMGPSKKAKAKNLNISIINENDFKKMIG